MSLTKLAQYDGPYDNAAHEALISAGSAGGAIAGLGAHP